VIKIRRSSCARRGEVKTDLGHVTPLREQGLDCPCRDVHDQNVVHKKFSRPGLFKVIEYDCRFSFKLFLEFFVVIKVVFFKILGGIKAVHCLSDFWIYLTRAHLFINYYKFKTSAHL